MYEKDLYEPIKDYFIEQGYNVKSEIKNCDVVLEKDNELIIIELKLNFNMTLLFQALERQKSASAVFVAIARPKTMRQKTINKMKKICSGINVGLIFVAIDSPTKFVEVILTPTSQKKNTKKAKQLMAEFESIIFDKNQGGSTKVKLHTAYKENEIKIACILYNNKNLSSKQLINEYQCPENTYNILYKNYNNLFEKISKGIYTLSPEGITYIDNNKDDATISYYLQE